jgi:hypothetical protein
VAAATARKEPLRKVERAALDSEGLPVDEGVGNFGARRGNNPGERRTRNLHLLRRLALFHALEVRQPERFQFLDREGYFGKLPERDAARLEVIGLREGVYPARVSRSCHVAQALIMNIRSQ